MFIVRHAVKNSSSGDSSSLHTRRARRRLRSCWGQLARVEVSRVLHLLVALGGQEYEPLLTSGLIVFGVPSPRPPQQRTGGQDLLRRALALSVRPSATRLTDSAGGPDLDRLPPLLVACTARGPRAACRRGAYRRAVPRALLMCMASFGTTLSETPGFSPTLLAVGARDLRLLEQARSFASREASRPRRPCPERLEHYLSTASSKRATSQWVHLGARESHTQHMCEKRRECL